MEIYGVDFDGTLCEEAYPEIGEPKQKIIDFVIGEKAKGHKLILWTCRGGEKLLEAIEWCNKQGIEFDAVNESLAEQIAYYNNDPRKIGATKFIDDRNITLKEIEDMEVYSIDGV